MKFWYLVLTSLVQAGFRGAVNNRLYRILFYFLVILYFGICLIVKWGEKKADKLMNDFVEFQLIVLAGGSIPSFLFETAVLIFKRKGTQMEHFGTFFYQFTPLLNCSMIVCSGLIVVIDNIQ